MMKTWWGHRYRWERGFTLVEMLVVVAIIALVASVALPTLGRPSEKTRLRAVADGAIAALQLTREAAIVRHIETVLTVDVEKHTLQSVVVPLRQFAPEIVAKLQFAAPEQVGQSGARFRFFPDGSSTGGTLTLALHDQREVICVLWLTGEARQPPHC
jgi:general secretion pathway protein H